MLYSACIRRNYFENNSIDIDANKFLIHAYRNSFKNML